MYLAMYQEAKENFKMNQAIDFFQSIEFLPLQRGEMFIYDHEEVHVPLANKPIASNLDAFYGYGGMDFHLSDFFNSSSISFSFYKSSDSKYAAHENIDTLYSEIAEQRSWYSDLERDTVLLNESGDKYLDLIIRTKGSNCVEREVTYYKNNAHYTFSYLFPVELINTPWFLELPNEILIDDLESEYSLEERRSLFFEDILSEDTERFLEVKEYLYDMKFEPSDSTDLKKMLYMNFDFADSEDTYITHTTWMHNQIVNKLVELDDEGLKPILMDYFLQETNPDVKINTYLTLKQKDWTDSTLADLILAKDSIDTYEYNYSQIFNTEIKDSLNRFISDFETYTTHFDQDLAGLNGLLGSVTQNWDTLCNAGFSQTQLIPQLEKWLTIAKDSIILAKELESYSWQHENTMNYSIKILANSESYENHELINSIKYIDMEMTPTEFLIYKLKHGIEISEQEWEYAEEQEWGLFAILLEFHKSGNSKLLPKRLRGEKKFMEVALTEILSEDWGDVEIVEHISTEKITLEGKKKSLSFMLITNSYSEGANYVSCIETLDLKNLNHIEEIWSLFYDYSYEEVVDGNTKSLINEILERYQE